MFMYIYNAMITNIFCFLTLYKYIDISNRYKKAPWEMSLLET